MKQPPMTRIAVTALALFFGFSEALAGPPARKNADDEDVLALKRHEVSIRHAHRKSKKFPRCFKTDETRRLSTSAIEIPYAALSGLRMRCIAGRSGIGNHDFIYALRIHFGLDSSRKRVVYIFEPVICVDTIPDRPGSRQKQYDAIYSRGYFVFDPLKNDFDTSGTRDNEERYRDYVKICRNGTGIIHRRFSAHQQYRFKDNARANMFPFQLLQAVRDGNNANSLFFFSVSKSDHLSSKYFLNKQKHNIIISAFKPSVRHAPRAGVRIRGLFHHKSANLGSLCPVNCNTVYYTIAP